jgi:hypothetical protein
MRSGRRELGMPKFESLTDNQLLALQHYIREQANLQLAP